MKKKSYTTFAAIHLGSEMISMQIVEYRNMNKVKVIEQCNHRVKLGEETFKNKIIPFSMVSEICELLQGYKRLMSEYGVEECSVQATTAVREALNQVFLLDQIYIKTGLKVKVVDMPQEIYTKYTAIRQTLRSEGINGKDYGMLLMDISSGGLGITFVDDEKIALIGRPSFSQNPDIVVEYFVALKERLQMRYCYISYFFWWDPNSVMNADPDDYSWDTSKIDNSSEGDGGQDVDYPVGTQIVDSLALAENPYIDCIYKKLSTKSSTFRYYLGRFMGENSIAHLKFKLSDNLSSTVNGRFKCKMEDYWFSIELNEVRLMNLTPLMVAKTIMHEVIHADIFAKLMSLKSSLKSNLSVDEMKELSEALNDQNFPTLNYYYEKYVFDVTAQHQYMAEYFVDVIAAVLQEIDPTVSKETRTAIAWIGLTETKTVIDGKVIDVETEAWKALPTAEKKKLVEAYREYLETAKNECED